jgi:hypothetical protein
MRKARRSVPALLATAAAIGCGSLAFAAPASAAPGGCWGDGGSHTDYLGNTYGTRYCYAYTSGDVMNNGSVAGRLFSGTSWFVCQAEWTGYENPPVGGARNDYWLYTQADTGSAPLRGWGWFPATKVSGGGNYGPIPGLRSCDDIPFFPFPSP